MKVDEFAELLQLRKVIVVQDRLFGVAREEVVVNGMVQHRDGPLLMTPLHDLSVQSDIQKLGGKVDGQFAGERRGGAVPS